jgi:bifunctional UDP-N-acetylglucosamine pyrophosphorylase/glucosamine-1-phosphate N-acetyltransferase
MARAGTVVILAAGQGTRMKSSTPKVLHRLCGRTMLGWVIDCARELRPERLLVVVGDGASEVERTLRAEEDATGLEFVVQAERRGTGHALQVAAPRLAGAPGPIVVLYGDMPLLGAESLRALVAAGANGASLLTAVPRVTRGFGRIVRTGGPGGDGPVARIVEERDAEPAELAIREVNLGVYCFRRDDLLALLPRLANDNEQGEYYLTDVVALLVGKGVQPQAVVLGDEREAIGINTLRDLSEARTALQHRILERHLANGVCIEDPATTYVDHAVEIGAGTRILPCTVIRGGVTIGAGCEVGPFTHLRAGTVLEDGAELGNFTEAKQSRVGRGTKAKHLAYLGDVTIGARTNIGAGTVVANYDGREKHRTVIGDGAFIGSGTVLVAPSTVGDGASTGAGAIVTKKNIPAGEVWIGVPARPLAARKKAGGGGAEERG